MLKIIRCEGNGQGSCKGCDDKGIWTGTGCAFCTRYRGRKVATAINA